MYNNITLVANSLLLDSCQFLLVCTREGPGGQQLPLVCDVLCSVRRHDSCPFR